MSRLKSTKSKWLLIALAVGLLVLLAGCTPSATATHTTEDLKAGNFWESNVVYYFSLALDTFARWFGGEYGLSILVMVIIVRTLILPLTLKSVKSTKAMQAIQPQLAKIKEQYKDNPQLQQQETMKLFQENKVNPMAGCLPMLIQMPVFIALYNSIIYNPLIREHTFLWLELGKPDHLFILPALAALSTYVQTKMMSNMNPAGMQGPMQFMMFIYPVLIFIMAYNFPAALPLYWVFSNIYTIVQNYFIYKKPADEVAVVEAAPVSGKSKRGGSNLKAGTPARGTNKEANKKK
ncbi:YidC/Oxa1 family membrane protein insertase [Paenibacillus sp. YPG26]|uniref:YidC/Oxa1 family membrane protein insertase n=1 Tax=Paenibacillus sp. YPG26 TaxID=2878915 RepID=UPI0020407816|nr:YidC/Oxa1 family membrane protein insertase [Paenibacillus sp. YPG26]USB33266.1 YidC/Oxa1 family membrane protein insertase [Paenibacillus sp. YPG26]